MTTAAVPAGILAAQYGRDRIALVAFWLLAALMLAALAAPLIAPQNPYDLAQLDILDAKLAPGTSGSAGMNYWLGTDDQGRDMLSAILYGLRISLGVGIASTAIALGIGLITGLAAARAGGWIDGLIMRVVDLQLSFPACLLYTSPSPRDRQKSRMPSSA